MNSAHWRIALPAAALAGFAFTPAIAQRPPNAEQQRIAVLEQQVAAGQASSIRFEQRLDSIERQLQQLINQGEVGGHQVTVLQSDLATLRSDVDARLTAIESRPPPQPLIESSGGDGPEAAPPRPPRPVSSSADDGQAQPVASAQAAQSDPGEEAYSLGFHLWQDGKYDQAVTALRSFTAAFPKHRRVSFANNLVGRALLDEGQPRAAAEALLANYRSDPKGERAPDSLYYLGQALVQLKQPAQACKAYGELEDVYGASVRPDLKALVVKGKADAGCS